MEIRNTLGLRVGGSLHKQKMQIGRSLISAGKKMSRNIPGGTKRLKKLRFTAYTEQDGACYWCYEEMNLGEASKHNRKGVTAEHLVSFSKGGGTNRTNIVAACFECNTNRSGKTEEEFQRWLIMKWITGLKK